MPQRLPVKTPLPTKAEKLKMRKGVATHFEYKLLDRGFDAQVFLSTTDSSILYIVTILMNRPFAHRFYMDLIDEYSDEATLAEMGFKKVVLSNGYTYVTSYSIKK